MDSIEIEKIIESKLDSIVNSIVFFYGPEHDELIKKRIANFSFYVFSNDYSQHNRLKHIDTYDIAKEFSRDITLELNLNDVKKDILENELAIIIKEGSNLSQQDLPQYLQTKLSDVDELKDNLDLNISKLTTIIGYYNDDYKIKEINTILDSKIRNYKVFKACIISSKNAVLRSILKIYVSDNNLTEELWTLLQSFNPSLSKACDSESARAKILGNQKRFYSIAGYSGNTLEELVKDVKRKGKVIVDAQAYKECIKAYDYYSKNDLDYLLGQSSLPRIIQDTKDKGYIYNVMLLISKVFEPWLEGINIAYCDRNKNISSFVVYNNDGGLYNKSATMTIIHEIIHYLGGINVESQKRGLCYYDKHKYECLEESFANFVASAVANEYIKKNGDILEVRISGKTIPFFDCTKSYMSEVFKLYKNELINIHASNEMTLENANKLCPFDEIADAVTRIYDAEEYNKECIIKEEISKLTRGIKR